MIKGAGLSSEKQPAPFLVLKNSHVDSDFDKYFRWLMHQTVNFKSIEAGSRIEGRMDAGMAFGGEGAKMAWPTTMAVGRRDASLECLFKDKL